MINIAVKIVTDRAPLAHQVADLVTVGIAIVIEVDGSRTPLGDQYSKIGRGDLEITIEIRKAEDPARLGINRRFSPATAC